MKIIKRNGSEAIFDISKIIAAVTKANNVVPVDQRLKKSRSCTLRTKCRASAKAAAMP